MYYCPRCRARLYKGEFGWNCHNCLLAIPFVYRGYRLPAKELQKLIKEGSTSLLFHWKRSDNKGEISGWLQFKDNYSLAFKANELSGVECPKCSGKILINEKGYLCSDCDFFLWNTLAGRMLQKEEVRSLLIYRKTDILHKFINSESGKYFSARVELKADGSLEFCK